MPVSVMNADFTASISAEKAEDFNNNNNNKFCLLVSYRGGYPPPLQGARTRPATEAESAARLHEAVDPHGP